MRYAIHHTMCMYKCVCVCIDREKDDDLTAERGKHRRLTKEKKENVIIYVCCVRLSTWVNRRSVVVVVAVFYINDENFVSNLLLT